MKILSDFGAGFIEVMHFGNQITANFIAVLNEFNRVTINGVRNLDIQSMYDVIIFFCRSNIIFQVGIVSKIS